jgi:pimeloyl-ACP methyl ester carboxylesterase
MVHDAVALHEALGGDERAVLVGHDWGALVTYGAASFAPERWRRVVTLAIPPAAVMGSRLLSFRQVKMFWYQYVFQSPVAELIVGNDDFEFIERLWSEWSPGYEATADLPAAKAALRDPANLAAALSTYRATYDPTRQDPTFAAQTGAAWSAPPQPTLYAHGIDDGCAYPPDPDEVRPHLAEGSQVLLVPDAGHFLHLERPHVVNPAIVAFLTA